VDTASPTFLVLDLAGTFAFALNGALTAIRVVRLDIVGVLTLGVLTALGGGMLRDIVLGALPPATFSDWRYLAVAVLGSLVAFLFGRGLDRLAKLIVVLDAAGLSLFAVSGALKGLDVGAGVAQAVILGAITAVGGGTLRDVLIREIPQVLSSGLYAIPALVGAFVAVIADRVGADLLAAIAGSVICFVIRMLGVHFGIDAPSPRGTKPQPGEEHDERHG
jgi:uncharacterized membrane protein YeiH